MRSYGRIWQRDAAGNIIPGTKGVWVVVETTPDGDDSMVWLTTLAQNLQLNTGESPFDADRGIPQQASVIQQFFPDFWVWKIQAEFSPYFASLIIAKVADSQPHYRVNVTTRQGFKLSAQIAV